MSLTETFNLYVDKLYFNIKTLYLFGGKKYTITFYLWNLWFGFVDNKMILTQWIKEVPLYAGADTWMVTFLPGRNENWHQPQTQLFSASLGALHCPAGRNKRGMHRRVKFGNVVVCNSAILAGPSWSWHTAGGGEQTPTQATAAYWKYANCEDI